MLHGNVECKTTSLAPHFSETTDHQCTLNSQILLGTCRKLYIKCYLSVKIDIMWKNVAGETSDVTKYHLRT